MQPLIALAALLAMSSGCRAVGDIFKAGVWVGVVVIIAVVAIVGGVIRIFMR